jgi:hypothetical protein
VSRSPLGRFNILRHRRGDDLRMRGLSLRASGLLLRLMMSRTCTSFGAITGGPTALAEEVGVTTAAFNEAFAELEKSGLVIADWRARLVFISFLVEDDRPSNEKAAIGRGRMLGDLPECDLRRRIAAACIKFAGPFREQLAESASNIGQLDDVEELLDIAQRQGRP